MGSKPHARRRLFDGEEGRVLPPAEQRPGADEERMRRETERWNFDFVRGVPLPGNWEWERVLPPPTKDPEAIESISGGEAAVGEGAPEEPPCGEEVGVELNLEAAEEGVKEREEATPLKSENNIQKSRGLPSS